MNDHIEKLILTFLGGAISASTGLGLFVYKRKREAKDAFLISVSMQKHSIDKSDFYGWHQRTKPELRDAVSKVYPFLSPLQRRRMDAIWIDYENISYQQMKQEDEADHVQELEACVGIPQTPKPSHILHEFFQRFADVTG